jgi:hypothetical protein
MSIGIIFTSQDPNEILSEPSIILKLQGKPVQDNPSSHLATRFAVYRALVACPLESLITLCIPHALKNELLINIQDLSTREVLKLADYPLQEAISHRMLSFGRHPRLSFYGDNPSEYERYSKDLSHQVSRLEPTFDLAPFKTQIELLRRRPFLPPSGPV